MITIEERMKDKAFVDSLPTNRLEALAQGEKYYYSKPCKYGHNSYRKASNGQCCKCGSDIAAEYAKTIEPEKYKARRKNIDSKWNNGEKAKASKQKWKDKDPKWAWVVSAVGGAKTRSKRKDLPFALTNDYIYKLTNSHCPVLGTEFIFAGNKCISDQSPSIDRIDPKLGYVEGNVAVISMKANMIKSNATWEEIQKVATWLKEL